MNKQDMIKKAAELAYEEDRQQVVGLLNGELVIRDWEDPESDLLRDAVIIAGDGEIYGGDPS